eukprot:scpid65123/ scgid14788/ DnaJ homolog subfamily B member 12
MKRPENGESEDEVDVDYTDEQVMAVKRVENAKDYYTILGVPKNVTADDLKRTYRRLALVLHPDKNHAPGAAEAFKQVVKAFGTLSDPEKRAKYDKYGEDENGAHANANKNSEMAWAYFERCYGGNVSPEEVFNIFFGGRSRSKDPFEPSESAKFYYRTAGDSSVFTDIQRILPLVALLCLFFLSSLLSDWYHQTTWSASSSSLYSVPRRTQSTLYDIEYFVASSFELDYPTVADILRLEKEVEEKVVSDLKHFCSLEKSTRDQRVAAAQRAYFPDPYQIHQLKNQQLKNCEKYKQLKKNVIRSDPVLGQKTENTAHGDTPTKSVDDNGNVDELIDNGHDNDEYRTLNADPLLEDEEEEERETEAPF